MNTEPTRLQWWTLTGLAGTLAYLLHIVVGRMHYPGYDPLRQAISDLTADTAPSRESAVAFATLNSTCTVVACTLFCIFYQGRLNRLFRTGIYCFTAMQWLSALGYLFFPLSASGYRSTVQDTVHLAITGVVVLLTIAALVCLALGALRSNYRHFGIFTLVMLAVLFSGALASGLLPRAWFGIGERLSVYSIVLYTAALTLFTFRFPARPSTAAAPAVQ